MYGAEHPRSFKFTLVALIPELKNRIERRTHVRRRRDPVTRIDLQVPDHVGACVVGLVLLEVFG